MKPPSTPNGTRSATDWLTLAALVVCWGSAFAIIKIALETIAPIWTVSLRMLSGTLLFLPVFWVGGHRLPRNLEFWLWMSAISLIGTTLPFFLMSWGTQYNDTGVSGVLIGAVPLFTVALAHFTIPGERARTPTIIGFVTGFAGLIVLLSHDSGFDLSGGQPGGRLAFYGQMAIVFAALGYAFQGICAKRMPPASPWQKTMAGLLISLVPTFAASFLSGIDGISSASWSSLLAVAGLGVLSTALAGILMFRLVASAGPSFTSLTSYLIPVYTLMLGALLFGEKAGAYTLIGLVLILSGIAISEFWPRLFGPGQRKVRQLD